MKINCLLFSILFLCGLVSCKDNDTIVPENQELIKTSVNKIPFTIDIFTDVPKEIDGCACHFSKDAIDFKAGKYIYVNNFAETSFVKINDTLVEFKQTAYRKADTTDVVAKYISNNYKMMILVKNGKPTGEESSLKTGLIKITNSKGRSVKQTLYGECGC